MDEKEFNGEQRPMDEAACFRKDYYSQRLKKEESSGCGCALIVLVLLALAIAGIIWLVTGTK